MYPAHLSMSSQNKRVSDIVRQKMNSRSRSKSRSRSRSPTLISKTGRIISESQREHIISGTDFAKSMAAKSAEIRYYRKKRLDEMVSGQVRLRDLVQDEKMYEMKLLRALMSFPQIKKATAMEILENANISFKRKLGGMNVAQFNQLGFIIQNMYPTIAAYI